MAMSMRSRAFSSDTDGCPTRAVRLRLGPANGDTPDAAPPTDQDEVLHEPAKNERTMRVVLRCPSTRTSREHSPAVDHR